MKKPLMDCHVHLDKIVIHNRKAAKDLCVRVGDVRWKGVALERHLQHIKNDRLNQVFVIYENQELVFELRSLAPNCDVRAMFFVRNPAETNIEHLKELHDKGLLNAIKVHPVVDNFELTSTNLKKILAIAGKFHLPILYHSDDRRSSMHLTSPELQRKLVEENSGVIFIIGHGGAYAHPRLVGQSPQTISYWDGPCSRRRLIKKALELTKQHENVYYDLSVATNAIKAALIADFANKHADVAERVLIGTDFPIKFASAQSQLQSLQKAGLKKSLVEKIASNRL